MKHKKFIFSGIVVCTILLGLGFLLPLGSYTTSHGCPDTVLPTKRLHLIFGDSIEEIKKNDNDINPPPNVGCSINTKYVLYLL